MVEVEEEVMIARTPEAVWTALADFGGIVRWAPNVDHSCVITDRQEGVGAVRRVQVGRTAVLERVVAWEPNDRLSYEIDGMPPVVRSVINTWRLERADGSTRVRLSSSVDAGPRPPQQLIARVVGRVLGRASREMLRGLQRHLDEATT